MTEGGGVINGREYSQHAMERMSPDTPQVRAELSRRAEKAAEQLGYKPGTQKYYEFCKKYVDPRNISPSVIEDAIASTKPIKATINPNKLTGYALNPEHPVGSNKAKVFENALEYNQSNADGLMKQIYEKLPQNEAILGKIDQYGQRYTVDIPITGPNGNTVNVRTGWIIKTGSDVPELTTIFVK